MNPQTPKGKIIDFHPIEETWNLYRLEDGNYLRIKAVIVKCIKTEQINPDGSPVYWFQTANVATTLTTTDVQKLYKKEEGIT